MRLALGYENRTTLAIIDHIQSDVPLKHRVYFILGPRTEFSIIHGNSIDSARFSQNTELRETTHCNSKKELQNI